MGKLARRAVWWCKFRELDVWAADNLQADLSVEALADRALMSRTSFWHAYKEVTGLTPARAIEELRLAEACRLLDEDNEMSLERVAHAVGWGMARMRRAFRRRLDMTPDAWRELEEATRPGGPTMTEAERQAYIESLVATINNRVVELQSTLDQQFARLTEQALGKLDRMDQRVDRIETRMDEFRNLLERKLESLKS